MNPQRKIGNSHTSAIRGLLNSDKSEKQISVESALEADFVSILEFDINVENYVEQPVTITYDLDGKKRKYTPDFLVRYLDETTPSALVEIKYRKDIRENWTILKPKFKAAKKYALSRGWIFKIYTEDEIRGVYLENVKFLLYYKNNPLLPNEGYKKIFLKLLSSLKETTPEEILQLAFNDKAKQAELIPTMWYLVSTGFVGADLFTKLSMKSSIWEFFE